MKLCEYGCGKKAKKQFKNGKWCCDRFVAKCPEVREKMSLAHIGKPSNATGKKRSIKTIELIKLNRKNQIPPMFGKKQSIETKLKIGKANKLTLTKIKERYPFLLKVEELSEDPKTRKIKGRCKNHQCKNSKENNGWFNISSNQISKRVLAIYRPEGFGDSFFYCSDRCKGECILFNLRSDPYKIKKVEKYYTYEEYQTFREYVFERENGLCQYCGEPAEHVHHIRPKKLEPFFALDPDYGISCCEKCHYKYGHKKGTECSLDYLAKSKCKQSKEIINA